MDTEFSFERAIKAANNKGQDFYGIDINSKYLADAFVAAEGIDIFADYCFG